MPEPNPINIWNEIEENDDINKGWQTAKNSFGCKDALSFLQGYIYMKNKKR